MTKSKALHLGILLSFLAFTLASPVLAEEDYTEDEVLEEETVQPPPAKAAQPKPKKNSQKRKFVTDHPERSDAGIFHVGFAVGGNFYMEPEFALDASTGAKVFADNYTKDFGFQGGAYFDYDYSQLDENIPLGLRGFVGYKYILNTTHAFSIDGMVRRMFNFSEKVAFGLGVGGSAAIWFRQESDTSDEETLFLPSLLIGAGFEFEPFMVDFKWLVNRIGSESTIMGFELYFGVRL